jgi:diguanylate cyclase (GGDEF)-like protein
MTEATVHRAYARIGDALMSASMCPTAVSALETLLGDAVALLGDTRLVVVRGDEQLAAAGPNDDELLAQQRRLISSRARRASTPTWLLSRHTVPGLGDLHLLVARPRDRHTTAHDDAVVRILTGAVALVIRTAPTDEQDLSPAATGPDILVLRRNRLLELLLAIQRRISNRAPLQDILEAIVEGASRLTGDDAAVIHLVDPDDPEWLQPVAWTNLDDEWLAAIRRVRMGEGAAGRAAHEQRLVVLETYRDAVGRLQDAVNLGVAAAMAAPVYTAERTMGAIVVKTRDENRRYSAEDRAMLLAFAGNVSLALTDAHNLQRMDEALHDAVTGLPTRTLFLDRLRHVLGGADAAILFCDLDRFKRVNDSLGHAAGDELLLEVARRLSSVLRPTDTAARLGGDEFAVLLEDVDEASAETIAARIIAAFAEPFRVRGHAVRLGISVGLALATSGNANDGEHLLSAADIAMYHAKRAGGSRLRRFEPTMATTAVAQLTLETDLQRALPGGELHLVYQPIFDLWADRVAGVETLLRWTNPRRGPVPPSAFIPLAEECGLMADIDAWVIDTACDTLRGWQRMTGREDLDLGVNLSARRFGDPGLVRTIERALDTSGIDPARFVIEITERVVLADIETAVTRLHDVRALGVRVALDDFGTGYSSLSHLRQLPIDLLKIDRAFLPESDDDRGWALTTAIVRMSSDLGMVAIAEGIETQQQLSRLLKMGCPDGQGLLLSPPVPGADLVAAADRRLPRTHAVHTPISPGDSEFQRGVAPAGSAGVGGGH